MPSNNTTPTKYSRDLSASYSAIVDYHNTLVQARFTVVGLFLAANAFLATGFFQGAPDKLPAYTLPVLGSILTAICWLLELRTYQLLDNLGTRGSALEKEILGDDNEHGFFSLMKKQPLGPKLLILRIRFETNSLVKYLVSHSFGIGALYAAIGIFWLIALKSTICS